MKKLLLSSAIMMGLALTAQADFITGYGWFTVIANNDHAAPATLNSPTCHVKSDGTTEPCTLANYDVKFTTEGIGFDTRGISPQTLGAFLTSSAFPINNKSYQNGVSDARLLDNNDPMIYEFVGNGQFTGTPAAPQLFTFEHDDGLTFTVNGQIVVNKPDRTSAVSTQGSYTGGAGTNLPFQLIYEECCTPPAVLKTTLVGPVADPNPLTLTSLIPAAAAAGGPDFILKALGTGFVSDSVLMWNGSPRPTTNITPTQLSATIFAADISAAGTASVNVVNTAAAATSNALPFTINSGNTPNPPAITFSANPPSIQSGAGSRLDWTITNATSAVIDQGIGAISPTGGSLAASPAHTTIYTLTAWGLGGSAHAQVTLTVTQASPVLARLQVIPAAATVIPGETIPFTVQGFDQNGNPISAGTVTWSINSPNSSGIDPNTGLYTAGPAPSSNADTITAHSGSLTAIATVFIQNPGGFQIQSVTAVPNPVTGATTMATVTASDANGGTLTYSWNASGPGPVAFSSPNAPQSTVVFHAPGIYTLNATVFSTTFPGLPLTAGVSVTVIQTISSVLVTPPLVTIFGNQSADFQAQVLDQFGMVMSNQAVTWSAAAGQISGVGRFSPTAITNQIVIVTATSQSDPTKQGTGQVRIIPVGSGGSFDISDAHVYPVPWKSTGSVPYLTFTGLATGTEIKIFSSTARQISRLASVNGEDVHWFVTNDGGERVSSGVYMYRITNPTSNQTVKGKLVIIQ